MLIKIFFSLIIALLVWQGLNILHIFLKRQFLIVSDEVVKRNEKLWEQCLLLTGKQVKIITTLIRNVTLWWFKKKADEQLQVRKGTVLQNVVNHLNQNLSHDLQLKTINPATTGGIDIWVYLANKLNDDEQLSLENYFTGVLSKYTREFALDVLTVELVSGAGWVAKFDVKTIEEATYNRMTRQTKFSYEEDF
ncbi:hypothetical protein QP481_04515 [Streptococcus oralis]|jgi:hypothetical protein|uniref:hypothetical protein n=1 Tax=Streptococcus TaxID=1301 RepID=UPI000A3F2EDF|nr:MULTISPECIES: hypothetical protein [Streptococcus]MDK7307602.1 hypothetical protein [Streptococcus oralis]MDK7311225.1 hypothetical protein [Streptococcus oralis]